MNRIIPSAGILSSYLWDTTLANPVPLTVPAVTAAVEPSAMESVESSTAMHFAAGKPSADKALVSETSAAKAVAVEIAVEPALESARAVKAAAVKPVKPRACADKHATREPLRSIIAVRRAGVRVIVIVAVGANRWRAVVGGPIIIAGAHAYAHKDSLRVRK